ncbi:S-layer homology domain-containing protein [Desulforamulus ruminis]|uniref:S-layer domain-containing protein n=1 Tax=Desulforamulus ruminis (strain ATCC 23193 / DSM 2154 / NCIMB 8452 / DL) TaxID=696281 RepID=F6DV31_DESRL|nr:S-layer homology domain-containing protein [Desulforamulus ruminis]AEG59097.1 S-layer domain-containing protein [Desulforamulus ruminis DSM 2154]
MLCLLKRNNRLFLLALMVLCLTLVPVAAWADGDIKISIADPDKPDGANYEGTTVYKVLETPTVIYGENRALGTLRVTGKEGIQEPLRQGNKILVSLPAGLSYMQVPNAENYKNYVQWPETVDGMKNQIADAPGAPGVKFIAGTPRSITLEVGNIDQNGENVFLDILFNKEDFSTVRVSKLLDIAEEYQTHPAEEVTRLDFVKIYADVVIPFDGSLKESDESLTGNFSDLPELTAKEEQAISGLIHSGLVAGYPGGAFKPEEKITRAEAVAMVGRLFPEAEQRPVFKDKLPGWAVGHINGAAARGLVIGYPDGTFRADHTIIKSEALALLQRLLESYCSPN